MRGAYRSSSRRRDPVTLRRFAANSIWEAYMMLAPSNAAGARKRPSESNSIHKTGISFMKPLRGPVNVKVEAHKKCAATERLAWGSL